MFTNFLCTGVNFHEAIIRKRSNYYNSTVCLLVGREASLTKTVQYPTKSVEQPPKFCSVIFITGNCISPIGIILAIEAKVNHSHNTKQF